jgi:predicted nucleic acid-binding protein
VTFVDTNVFMYAVGREHPLRERARAFLVESLKTGEVLVTSAGVLQELLHAYLPVGRLETLDAALMLARGRMAHLWPMEAADVDLARTLVARHSALQARDLLHVACCMRRDVEQVMTFDRALASAFPV